MNFPIFEETETYLDYFVFWGAILVVGVTALLVVFYYARRFFNCISVTEITEDRKKKKVQYVRKGKMVEVSQLKFARKHPGYKPVSIVSESPIAEGTLLAFEAPERDVTITYRYIEPVKAREKGEPILLDLPKELQKFEPSEILLLSPEDVVLHLEKTNYNPENYPVLNVCKKKEDGDQTVLILYAGEAVYAILTFEDSSAKIVFRSDESYVSRKKRELSSLTFYKEDVYSVLLAGSFRSPSDFFGFLDRCYRYVLSEDYDEESGKYSFLREKGEASNSLILSTDSKLISLYDPAFDRARLEAEAKRKNLLDLAFREARADVPLYAPRDEIYSELNALDDEKYRHLRLDSYVVPNEFVDGEYVEPPLIEKKVTLKDISEALDDILPAKAARLDFRTFLSYVMDHQDMMSLTIDLPEDPSSAPITMRFLDDYFAYVYQKGGYCIVNLKLDEHTLKRIASVHKNILHVRNGEEQDWYRLVLDSTYGTYGELYQIFLSSYTYVKNRFYHLSSVGTNPETPIFD